MALSEVVARLGFTLDDTALKKAQSGMNGLMGKLQQYAGLLAGSLIVRGVARFIDNLTTEGDALAKTSKQLGISTDGLQKWQAIAGYAGVEISKFNVGLKTLAKQAYDADRGLSTSVDAFNDLGVAWKDGAGNLKEIDVLLQDVGIALGENESATERVALASQLLGRAGYQLLPAFADGAEGLEKLRKRFEEMGGGLTEEFLPLAEAARDRFLDWKIASDSLTSRFAVAFLPILNRSIGYISRFMGWVGKITDGTQALTAVMIVLGAVSLAPLIKMVILLGRAALLPLAKFAFLFLLIEDLMTFFAGGDSVIGRGLDSIFGKGASNTVRRELKGLIGDLESKRWGAAFQRISAWSQEMFSVLGHELVKITLWYAELGAKLGSLIAEGFSVVGGAIVAAIVVTAGALVQAAKELASDVVNGLIDGIVAGKDAVAGAIKGLFSGGLLKAERFLETGSPSKKAMRLAQSIPDGVIKTLIDSKVNVGVAMNHMIPDPLIRPVSFTQTNHNQINVKGGPANADTGRAVGQSVAQRTRVNFDAAAAMLVPKV